MVGQDKVMVSFVMPEEQLERLERFCNENRVARSRVLRLLVMLLFEDDYVQKRIKELIDKYRGMLI